MIRNVWCVGRNYADHAKELGNAVPETPLIFLKAGSCVTTERVISLPAWAGEVHHELEIAFQFGAKLEFTLVGLALDLTERNLQNRLKAQGQPWTLAKSFTGACPLSELQALPPDPVTEWGLRLEVNEALRQQGRSPEMIFPPEDLRKFVLEHFPVVPGDLLLTGTPAGVGPLRPGDRLRAGLFADGRQILEKRWEVAVSSP